MAESPYYNPTAGQPQNDTKLSSLVELSVSCRNLQDKDTFSKSDPMCVMYTKELGSDKFQEFGRTEMIKDCLNPDFAHKFVLQYHFEEQQCLKFELYDIDSSRTDLKYHDFLGYQTCTLSEVVAYQGTKWQKPLIGPNKRCNYGTILLVAEELRMCKNFTTLVFFGQKLSKKSIFRGLDPFLVILKQNDDNSFSVVHKTQVQKGTSKPTWMIKISLSQLCNGIYDRLLKFQCYDWARSGTSHRLIGEFTTDFQKLSQGPGPENSYEIIDIQKMEKNKKYKKSGQVDLTFFNIEEKHTFLDYIKGGTQVHCTVAIDFTASNGDPRTPASLHYISGSTPNPYAIATRAVVEIIEDYDSDKQFPALGFGAKLPPDGRVSHEFFLNGHPTNPYCAGVEGIMEAYYRSIHSVQLYGPTNFAPVINHVAYFAKSHCDGFHYFILLIITDGIITDMPSTKEAIVNASELPLSIIIVGVGNADFSAMNELDADDAPLCSRGRYAVRDIVQALNLSPMKNHNWNSHRKTSCLSSQEALKEVNRLMETSVSAEDDKMLNLFSGLKNYLEKKIVTEKIATLKQTTIHSFFKQF